MCETEWVGLLKSLRRFRRGCCYAVQLSNVDGLKFDAWYCQFLGTVMATFNAWARTVAYAAQAAQMGATA